MVIFDLIERAKAAENSPRFHGNGFIQLRIDADGAEMLHVWHPDFPPLENHSALIHDHSFSLESNILMGGLRHTVYDFASSPDTAALPLTTHEAYEVDDKGKFELVDSGLCVRTQVYNLATRSFYTFPAKAFHTSAPMFSDVITATYVRRVRDNDAPPPRVLVELGATPDNAFPAKASKAKVKRYWAALEEAGNAQQWGSVRK